MNFKTFDPETGMVTLEVIGRDLPLDRRVLKVGDWFHTTPANAEVAIQSGRAVEVSGPANT